MKRFIDRVVIALFAICLMPAIADVANQVDHCRRRSSRRHVHARLHRGRKRLLQATGS